MGKHYVPQSVHFWFGFLFNGLLLWIWYFSKWHLGLLFCNEYTVKLSGALKMSYLLNMWLYLMIYLDEIVKNTSRSANFTKKSVEVN